MTRDCPSRETLTAFLVATVSQSEREDIDDHLLGCAACVQFVRRATHRLRIDAEVDVPVPAALTAQVRPAPVAATVERHLEVVTSEPEGKIRSGQGGSFGERLRGSITRLRPATFAPFALAALALLVIVSRPPETTRGPGEGPAVVETMRITVATAEVVDAPGLNGRELAELHRGSEVRIVGEEGAWYRVRLDDGREGWIERRSFE